MVTVITARLAAETEVDDTLSYFVDEESAENIHTGRTAFWGLILGGGLWVGIFALASRFLS